LVGKQLLGASKDRSWQSSDRAVFLPSSWRLLQFKIVTA